MVKLTIATTSLGLLFCAHSLLADPPPVDCIPDNPAAEIDEFWVVNGIAQWHVSSEYETAGYVVEGSQSATGPWTQIGSMEMPGAIDYSVDVSGSGFPVIRLVEVETIGSRRLAGIEESISSIPVDPPSQSYENIVAQLDALEQEFQTTGVTAQSNGISYVIFTPSMFLQEIQDYVAHYWETRAGYVPTVVDTDAYPTDRDDFRNALKAAIANHASNGAKYFHLIGDFNDHREFDGELFPFYWVGDWEEIRGTQLSTYDSRPQNDIIPSFVIPDLVITPYNMAGDTPYYFSDQEYADTDGDLVPDVVVTRWPVTLDAGGLATEVVALALKMWTYNDTPHSQAAHSVSMYVYDFDYVENSGDGARASASADLVTLDIPMGSSFSRIDATSFQSDTAWRIATRNDWEVVLPDLTVSIASRSSQRRPGHLVLGGELSAFAMPVMVSASCSSVDFVRSTGFKPKCESILERPDQGPISLIGPTAGSWQTGNETVARYVAKEILSSPDQPVAESWLDAMRAVYDEHGGIPEVYETARSYVFLGDPLSPLKHAQGPPTDVAHAPMGTLQLFRSVPNPFNPATRITFTTTRRGHVILRIYDIRGRLVRTLIDETLTLGPHSVNWLGDDERGQHVNSGIYLYRLEAEGKTLTRKMVVVR